MWFEFCCERASNSSQPFLCFVPAKFTMSTQPYHNTCAIPVHDRRTGWVVHGSSGKGTGVAAVMGFTVTRDFSMCALVRATTKKTPLSQIINRWNKLTRMTWNICLPQALAQRSCNISRVGIPCPLFGQWIGRGREWNTTTKRIYWFTRSRIIIILFLLLVNCFIYEKISLLWYLFSHQKISM